MTNKWTHDVLRLVSIRESDSLCNPFTQNNSNSFTDKEINFKYVHILNRICKIYLLVTLSEWYNTKQENLLGKIWEEAKKNSSLVVGSLHLEDSSKLIDYTNQRRRMHSDRLVRNDFLIVMNIVSWSELLFLYKLLSVSFNIGLYIFWKLETKIEITKINLEILEWAIRNFVPKKIS